MNKKKGYKKWNGKARKGEHAVLGLATGVSPIYLYKELVKMHENGLSFSNVITFNLDEYYPMEPNSIQSYHRFMEEHLFSKIDIPKENINLDTSSIPACLSLHDIDVIVRIRTLKEKK